MRLRDCGGRGFADRLKTSVAVVYGDRNRTVPDAVRVRKRWTPGEERIREGRRLVKLPKIKTLNHQIDVIEANSTATEERLTNIEKLLERIAGQLEKTAV